MAVMLSGDGGWAGLDREVAGVLAQSGVAVVGWDSLRYFWTARTPDTAARDLGRIIDHYSQKWGKRRVIAVGYSLGADTMPFMVNRLPREARDRLALTALLAPGREAFFEFHVALWLGKSGGGLALAPEMARLANAGVLCLYGDDEPGLHLRRPSRAVRTGPPACRAAITSTATTPSSAGVSCRRFPRRRADVRETPSPAPVARRIPAAAGLARRHRGGPGHRLACGRDGGL